MINSYRPSDHTNLAHLTVRASFSSFEPSASTNVVVVVVVVA